MEEHGLRQTRFSRIAAAAATFVAVLAVTATAHAAPPLVAQWPLDSGYLSGGSEYTEDVSGNGLALTSAANTMRFGTESGKFGGYLAGTNTSTLEVDSPLLAPPQLTLLAWVKQSGFPGTLRYIAGRGDDGGNCGGSSYALYTGYSGSPGLHFYVRTAESGGTNVLTDVPADSSVFDGNWHLIAGTYDGTDARLFVDGVEVGSPKPASGIVYNGPITDSAFYVDGYPPAAGCGGQPDFPGDIDEVRVYDRALSASELGRLAAAPGPLAPALIPDEAGASSSSPGSSPNRPPVAPLGISLSPVHTTTSSPGYTVLKIGSTGLPSKTTISIDGGKPIISLNPTLTPYVGLRLAEAGSHTITATSIGTAGASASSSTHVVLTAGSGELKKLSFLPDVAVAAAREALLTGAETAAVSRECVPNSTVVFGVAETTGCFKRINGEAEIPAAERPVAGEYAAENFFVEHAAANAFPVLHHGGADELRTLSPAEQPFVSSQPVMLDGMTITPRPGASVVVFPAISRIISSNARVSYDGSVFGSIPVETGALNLDLNSELKRFTSGDAELPLFHFNTSEAFKDIGGFPINGDVQVVFKKTGEQRYTALIVNVSLPEEIKEAAQADPTAVVEVNANNARGTYLNHLNIHLNEAFLGPVQLANVDFTYDDGGNAAEECPRKWWKATAEVFFIPGDDGEDSTGLKMAPEPQRNGVAFCAGKFHSAGATLEFGAAAPEIFPGVTLNKIGFDIRLADPALFDGSATIKSAELVTATGGFLSVFASPGHPYTIKAGDAGGTLAQLVGQTYESPTFALGGTVSVEPFKEVGLELGGAYLLYSYPDFVAAKGYAHLQTFLFTVNAEGSLELSTRTRRFNALVKGEICLAGGIEIAGIGLCAGGEARVSSRGASVCFDIAGWTPGVGYVYGNSFPEFFTGLPGDGCRPSHFWEKDVRAARASAVAPLTFTVKRGEQAKSVRLTSASGAPEVSVRTPGGETIASQANKMLHSGHLSAIAVDKYKATWISVEHAKPGTYQIISQPGSSTITGVAETHYEPGAAVSGKLTHHGRRYTLHYNAGHAAGQKVTFIERGKASKRTLRTVGGGKGTIAFEPQLGQAGAREIAAEIEVDGVPASPQKLARFSAPSPRRAGRVTHVSVTRGHGAIAVSWRKVPFAKSYSVILRQQGGGVRTLRVKGNAHAIRLRSILATESGKIEVIASGPLGDHGRAGDASFKALSKEQTRLLSFRELGKGAPFIRHKSGARRRR
jgi:hypothetical protein